VKPYIHAARVVEIVGKTSDSPEFACHKTTTHDDDGRHIPTDEERHCAGALILLEKMKQPHQMMRIMERLRLYDRRKLNMGAPV